MRAWLGTRYSRLVSRCVGGLTSRLPERRRVLHLSFDDGPSDAGTPELLEVLAEFAVPATFFLLGENVERHPDRARQIVAAGHAIGNHGFAHVDAWKVPRDVLERDFDEGARVLTELTGVAPGWLRPPFGRITRDVVRWSRSRRQRIAMWDLMPPDFEPDATAERVRRVLVRGVRRGSIVVLHDNAKSLGKTAAALRLALPQLRDAGWEFAALPATESDAIPAARRAA